ncbi:hypothetical protein FACS1894181_12850 [Bacteroidia bacterium]|nr:hypothetical protein FACS1894181_12850 [Bacteroidia bacterium]
MLCLLVSLATNAKTITINSSTAWTNLTADPSTLETGDVITLSASISGNTLVIPSTVTDLTIEGDGNGRTLTARIQASSDLALTLKNITVSNSNGSTIRTTASLTLATEGTVTITNGTSGSPAISVSGDFTITGGSPAITHTNDYSAASVGGKLTIDGNGTGALNGTGGTGAGIFLSSGYTLTLNKTGGGINIASTTGAVALEESTNINISGAGTTADVTGNIGGSLTVSDGTVTVTGTVSGTTTHTGGTINGDLPPSVPDAPTIGTATAGNGQADVTFTAPASNGGATIIGYTVTAVEDGTKTATGAASPITVSGLTNGTAYTFTVTATNSVGKSLPSAPSISVTPFVPLTYTATISPETFPAATVGYGAQAEQVFTITNTGTGDLANVQASLSTSDFEISTALSSATISAGSTATVSVQPKTGLAVGTHTGTLAITGDNSLSITASLSFTVNAAAYGISVGSFTGGSVSADKTSAAAGETVTLTAYPASGYELGAIRVHKTGELSVSFGLNGFNGFNGLNGDFIMPDYGVTVSASFSENLPPEPDPDAVALDGFIYTIRNLHVTVPQEEANTESDVAVWLKAYLARLFEDKGWDISVQTLTVVNFFPATAGTRTDVPGANGSFSFFAMLRKGYVTDRTYNMDGTVTATPYTTPVGNESVEASGTSVYFRNHTLYICSPAAETVEVYSFSGAKLLSVKKEAGEAGFTVPANLKAVIVRGSSGWTRKTANN